MKGGFPEVGPEFDVVFKRRFQGTGSQSKTQNVSQSYLNLKQRGSKTSFRKSKKLDPPKPPSPHPAPPPNKEKKRGLSWRS